MTNNMEMKIHLGLRLEISTHLLLWKRIRRFTVTNHCAEASVHVQLTSDLMNTCHDGMLRT